MVEVIIDWRRSRKLLMCPSRCLVDCRTNAGNEYSTLLRVHVGTHTHTRILLLHSHQAGFTAIYQDKRAYYQFKGLHRDTLEVFIYG